MTIASTVQKRTSARATLRMNRTIARISVLLKMDTAFCTDVSSSLWNSVTEPKVGGRVTPRAVWSDATASLGTVSAVIVGSVIGRLRIALSVPDSCCSAWFSSGR